MVDVGAKAATHRVAVASGRIQMLPSTLALVQAGTAKKGDVLGIARIAGIQGAKRTSDLIPLCHPLALTRVAVEFEVPMSSDVDTDDGVRGVAVVPIIWSPTLNAPPEKSMARSASVNRSVVAAVPIGMVSV